MPHTDIRYASTSRAGPGPIRCHDYHLGLSDEYCLAQCLDPAQFNYSELPHYTGGLRFMSPAGQLLVSSAPARLLSGLHVHVALEEVVVLAKGLRN